MPLSWPDLVLILAVVVVIFIAGKIPEVSGGLRRTVDNLRGNPVPYQIDPEAREEDGAGVADGATEHQPD